MTIPIWDLFFPEHKAEVLREIEPFLPRDPAGIVASYVMGKDSPFGADEWKKYFGVLVFDPPKLTREFYTWWFGLDPIEMGKQRCETHLPPVLRPGGMSLKWLNMLVQTAKVGHRSMLDMRQGFDQYESNEAGPTCWLVMCKEVMARGGDSDYHSNFISILNARTDANYEEQPSIIDLATVVFSRHVCSGEYYLGAKPRSWSRAIETVQLTNGVYQLALGSFDQTGLYITHFKHSQADNILGIAGLRKF